MTESKSASEVVLLTAEMARSVVRGDACDESVWSALEAIADGRAVVVPAEPTDAMLCDAEQCPVPAGNGWAYEFARRAYRAMLQAAQKERP